MTNSHLLALASTLSFAVGAQAFYHIGKRVHYLWLGLFKSIVATIIFSILFLLKPSSNLGDGISFFQFFFSGFLGLGLADLFILKSFIILRPGRTLLLTGFQPFFVALFSFLFLGHSFAWEKIYGIICFVLCSLVLSKEKSDIPSYEAMKGILYSFLGVLLNSFSCVLTRMACDQSPLMDSIEGNLIRLFGALACFAIFYRILGEGFIKKLSSFNTKDHFILIMGTIFAAVISLILYLIAVKDGDLATITAIGLSLPFFNYLFEIVIDKRPVTRPMVLSLILFIIGSSLIL